MNLIPAPASLVPASRGSDATSGLYFYGYRFYDPVTGRWPSRDPIGERGGLNLYGFIRNRFMGWDKLGLTDYPCKCDDDLGRFRNFKFSLVTRTGTGSTYEATDPASTIFNYVSGEAESDAKNLERRSDDQKENDTIKDIIEQKKRKSTLKQEIEQGMNAAKDAAEKGQDTVDKGGQVVMIIQEVATGVFIYEILMNINFEVCEKNSEGEFSWVKALATGENLNVGVSVMENPELAAEYYRDVIVEATEDMARRFKQARGE